MDIIASIHDNWFQLIASGEKTIEVRKSMPKDFIAHDGSYVYWYNTKTKKIEGRSKLIKINFYGRSEIYKTDYEKTKLSQREIQDYMSQWAFFWYLGDFEPLDIKLPEGKRPPQSWCYKDTIMPKPMFEKEELKGLINLGEIK